MKELIHHAPILIPLAVFTGLLTFHFFQDRKPKEKPPIPICAYCPNLREREARVRLRHPGRLLNHGICLSCKERMLEELHR